jgi:hypothetical protein
MLHKTDEAYTLHLRGGHLNSLSPYTVQFIFFMFMDGPWARVKTSQAHHPLDAQ